MTIDREDYKGARTLATVEHLGETFQIVRRRFNGKPWRRYVALLHGGVNMASGSYFTDVADAASKFGDLLQKTFTDRDELLARIQTVKHRAAGHCD